MSRASVNFSFVVGALIRKRVRFELGKAAQVRGLSIEIIDNGGWLETEYFVTANGDAAMVGDFRDAVLRWVGMISQRKEE
jgi:hypothetical protein